MRIADIDIIGPAAGREIGEPNRTGAAAVPVRVYEPEGHYWASLVWAHGGSFVRGSLDWPEADWAARRFAEAGVRVFSVDYMLVSDTVKAPAPSSDVAAVLKAVAAEAEGPVAIGGASAGGHLAVLAAVAQAERAAAGSARPADALLLQYPTLHRVQRPHPGLATATQHLPQERRFSAERIAALYDYYLGGEAVPGALIAGEMSRERLAQLPPAVIVNAELDELRASAEQFAEQLREAGVPVSEAVQPGAVHGYLNRPEESEQTLADATHTIERFVHELGRIVSRPE